MKSLLVVLGLLITFHLSAQDLVEELNFYGDIIANAHSPKHRARAERKFQEIFEDFAKQPNAEVKLPELKYAVVKQPDDKSFTIITWQLLEESESSYFGYLFKNGKVIKLNQSTNIIDDNKYSEMSVDEWYGAIYYNIKEEVFNGQKYYVLFGYNAYQGNKHVKVIDILTFDGDVPVLGAELFKKEMQGTRDDIAYRVVLPYTSDANVKVNYDDQMGMIIYDHIIRNNTPRGELFIPDGSYVGYKWDSEQGLFNYIDKVFNQTSLTVPSATEKKKKRKNKRLYKRNKR